MSISGVFGVAGRLPSIATGPSSPDPMVPDRPTEWTSAAPTSAGHELVGRTLTGPNLRAGEPADELVLLWRALLLWSGDPGEAEAALAATVEDLRPWSDRPGRLEIWLAGFARLSCEQDARDIHLLGGAMAGARADEITAVMEFLEASPPSRRMVLLGHHLGGFHTDELRRLIAAQPGGDDVDEVELEQWITHDSRVAADAVAIKPQHWPELMALSWPPVKPDRMLRAGSRRGLVVGAFGGVAAVAVLFAMLFGLDRGVPVERADPRERSSVSDGGTGGSEPGLGSESAADADLTCPARAWADQIAVSSPYQAGLQARPFVDALDEADAVVRASVVSVTVVGDGLRFELADPQVLEGTGPSPESFVLPTSRTMDTDAGEALLLPTLPDVLVFLDRGGGSSAGWEVSQSGGLWAECVGAPAVPLGAPWPRGPGWPTRPSPEELSRALIAARQETVEFTMTPDGDWAVGSFPLFDGRIAVLQLPAGMQPAGTMSAIVRPGADVLAMVASPVVGRLVLRQQSCDPTSQDSVPLAVCASSGQIVVDVASPLRMSDAWLERIDVFIVDPEEPGPVVGANHLRWSRNQDLLALDPTEYSVVWRTPLERGERLVTVGETTAALQAGRNLRVVGRASGLILWTRTIDPEAGLLPVGSHWLLGSPGGPPSFLELVEGRTGALLWRTAELPSADQAGQPWLIDPTGRGLVEVSREVVRLLDMGQMDVRWSTWVEGAVIVEAISEAAVIIRAGDGTRAVLDLDDGAVLAVGP